MSLETLLLYFTSGTTSKPKLVEHTHRSYPVGHLSTMYWLGLQPGDIEIHRSCADCAPARQGNVSLTKARNQRAQDENRCPHGLDQLVRRLRPVDITCVYFDALRVINRDLHAHHL